MNEEKLYHIALSLIPRVGPRLARNLVSYVGSAEGIFKEKSVNLAKIPGIGEVISSGLNKTDILEIAKKEMDFISSNDIQCNFYLEKNYPIRLKECEDSPIVIYHRGVSCFESDKVVSIVGTRKSSMYGEELCNQLVTDLASAIPGLVIVSGFAYGIDICAHKSALKNKLKTIAVFGHGLDTIYPAYHKKYVKQLLENGMAATEFSSYKKPDPGNFVSRNRIIAGLADATIVVESARKGGALITADMANSYHREVFAFPGRVNDPGSVGCNALIKQNKAALIESSEDLIFQMGWEVNSTVKPIQRELFESLPEHEENVLAVIKSAENGTITLDSLANGLKQPVSYVSATLLTLEFKGYVKALPGKTFKVI